MAGDQSDQLTGRRLDLPLRDDCETSASRCNEVELLTQLDGSDPRPTHRGAGSFDSALVSAGESFGMTFEEPGTVTYFSGG